MRLSIGMRNIKTATAVIICIIMTRLFALIGERADLGAFEGLYSILFIRSTPLYSCIAALATVGSSMHESYRAALSRILGTLIGGSFAVIHIWLTAILKKEFLYYPGVFIFIVLLIYITSRFFASEVTAASGMIFLIIIFTAGSSPAGVFALHRLIDTLGGVIVAIIVNGIFPIKNEKIL